MDKELEFYNEIKNWDFSKIKYIEECLTNWNMYDILNKTATKDSCILDLGTGGGEKVLKYFPKAKEIIGTDFSNEMIKTANNNLKNSNRTNIRLKKMDNLNMTVEANHFDIIVARHTCIDAKQIYNKLKNGGLLIVRGVDKLDCWELKKMFKRGQAYNDIKPISLIDYENILGAGFKDVELVPIHVREYYETKEDLLALLLKTPILNEFSNENDNFDIDMKALDKYINLHKIKKGILIIRRYYGITAIK